MARMHSRKKGRAGSKKPYNRPLVWVRYKPKEIELLIVKLTKEGKTSSQIGMVLRDTYGVPDVRKIEGKKVSKILAERKLLPEIPEDLKALMRKNIIIKKHLEANHKDNFSKRGLGLTESKIRRLVKYYKNSGRLDKSWTYDPEKIRLLIE